MTEARIFIADDESLIAEELRDRLGFPVATVAASGKTSLLAGPFDEAQQRFHRRSTVGTPTEFLGSVI